MEIDLFEFKCSCCNEIHKGVPAFGAEAPIYYYSIPENEKSLRTELTTDTCIIDNNNFYIKGCLEIPVQGTDSPFIFTSWISLSETNYLKFVDLFEVSDRKNETPMVGWYSNWVWKFETQKSW